jgi:hypothetical protein
MATQSKDSRERLGFAEAVAAHIAPVLAAQGFACTKAKPLVVRFESVAMVLLVSHDRLSYEIELTFLQKAHPSQRYTLHDILDAVLGFGHKEQFLFQASDRDRVVACVRAIAELLDKFGKSVLAGDSAICQRMAAAARLRNEAYTKQVVQTPIRRAAEEAWRGHDYSKVRELYESIEADLTPSETGKLNYARKKMES